MVANERSPLRRVGGRPLPRSKLQYAPLRPDDHAYALAPLDEVSLINGALKYCHAQRTFTPSEYRQVLDWLDHMYGYVLESKPWTLEEAVENLDLDKAAGPPFCYKFGPSKGDVLKNMSPEDLVQHFFDYQQYEDATTKDELRPVGKDARFFVPSNLQSVLVGNMLFGAQNQRMCGAHAFKPIKIGVITPGYDMFRLWLEFYHHPGQKYHTDGARFDSSVPLVMASICRDLRKRHLPSGEFFRGHMYDEAIDRYYSQIYNGLVNVGGYAFNLAGQLSGQTNTSSDNSLINLGILMLHAIRHGITYDEFCKQLFYVMGDDMALSDLTGKYAPLILQETYNSLNMYLESPCDQPFDITDIMFCGCSPKWREVGGRRILLYCYRQDRLLASYNWVNRGMTVNERAQKLVAICSLLFADEAIYTTLREDVREFFSKNWSHLTDETKSLLSNLNDQYLLKLFTGYESRANFGSFLDVLKGFFSRSDW